MANPATFTVYYNEEEERSVASVRNELNQSIEDLAGVEWVSVEQVNVDSVPNMAVVRVSFDEDETFSDELEFEISSFSFVHNAIEKV